MFLAWTDATPSLTSLSWQWLLRAEPWLGWAYGCGCVTRICSELFPCFCWSSSAASLFVLRTIRCLQFADLVMISEFSILPRSWCPWSAPELAVEAVVPDWLANPILLQLLLDCVLLAVLLVSKAPTAHAPWKGPRLCLVSLPRVVACFHWLRSSCPSSFPHDSCFDSSWPLVPKLPSSDICICDSIGLEARSAAGNLYTSRSSSVGSTARILNCSRCGASWAPSKPSLQFWVVFCRSGMDSSTWVSFWQPVFCVSIDGAKKVPECCPTRSEHRGTNHQRKARRNTMRWLPTPKDVLN